MLNPQYTRKAITAATTTFTTDGTRNVCHFRSVAVVSICIRYTSSVDNFSTKGFRIVGIFENGGIGPEFAEFGVDAPDEPGDEAGVFRREALPILSIYNDLL